MANACQSADVIAGNAKTDLVESIDWKAPWLLSLRGLGEPVAQRISAGSSQPDALNTQMLASLLAGPTPAIRFVSQSALPTGMAYEQYIFESGRVPTREGLHDFLNGIVWLHFPQTKRRLNQLHVAQIAKTGISPTRGPARDALTLFDENAALMRAPDALWEALVEKDWRRVFDDLRELWSESYLVLFGHALLEKLVCPRKSVTAHVYRGYPASDSIADLDAWMAADLSAEKLAAKPFAHLPVLGVPGWWPANQVAGFYDDTTVFRPARATAHGKAA
jgi:hypothetical protein